MLDAQQTMPLYLLPKNEAGGKCLDGTPAGFYYSPPPSGSSDLWVIYLKGGGACHDEQSCLSRANSSLGSSNYWPKTFNPGDSVNSDDPSLNPYFYQGHQVYAPYCSGDVWSGMKHLHLSKIYIYPSSIPFEHLAGQRTAPSSDPDTWGLYFSGHDIFERITQYLAYNMSTGSLLDAKYVLLAGGSAGGMGTFVNIQWLYTELRAKSHYKENVTIKAAPAAGWFFPGNTTDQLSDPMMPPNDYPHWIAGQTGGEGHNDSIDVLYDMYLDPKCVQALGKENAWHCGSVHNEFQFIEAPVFVLENKYDTNQITQQMLMPTKVVNNQTIGYVEYYGMDMDRSILTQLVDEKNEKNGLFYPSCFDHGGVAITSGKVMINGYNISELVGDWFWEYNKLPHFVYDTCNDENNLLPCNPTCNSYPPKNVKDA